MKKSILAFTAALILSGGLFVACNKTTAIQTVNTQQSQVKKSSSAAALTADNIGYYHNEALEYAFKMINERDLYSAFTDKENTKLVLNSLISEYFSKVLPRLNINIDQATLNEFLTDEFGRVKVAYSEKLQSAIDEGNAIIANKALNASLVERQLKSKLDAWDNNLSSSDEKLVLHCFVSVSISSSHYWEDNLPRWQQTLTAKSAKTKQGITLDGKSIARSDGQGAATGGAVGLITGSCLAGPVGTVVGGLVGAAEGASIGSACEALWQIFGW